MAQNIPHSEKCASAKNSARLFGQQTCFPSIRRCWRFLLILPALCGLFMIRRAFENPQEIRLSRDNQDKLLKVSPFKATVCREDRQHIKVIKETNVETTSPQMLMAIFYKTVTKPVQMGCNHIVRLGSGVYLEKGRTPAYCWDGHKYVCADDFNDKEHLCLVYTFGLSNDPSFEEAMAAGGCEVYAHDHTIKSVPKTRYKNLHFVKTGIGSSNTMTDKGMIKTLDTLLRDNGHSETVIDYLKIDVDGAERDLMFQWFRSGSITNVRQIGIEFHKVPQNVKIYFTIIQELYKLGYVTIAWDPNLTTKPAKGPFQYFEIVFRRSYVEDCED